MVGLAGDLVFVYQVLWVSEIVVLLAYQVNLLCAYEVVFWVYQVLGFLSDCLFSEMVVFLGSFGGLVFIVEPIVTK